jgi:hypothetical protein
LADTFTTRKRLRKPEVGANEGTWGSLLNAGVMDMVDEATGGLVSVSLTAGNVTLSANNGAADEARNPVIILTGTPGTTRTVTFPDVEDVHWVVNNSDSTATLTAGAGTTVSLLTGEKCQVYSDGATNMVALSAQYKTGTWSPTMGDGTNNYTLGSTTATYTKIGRDVFVTFDTAWSSIGSAGAGQLRIGGLPFTAAAQTFAAAIGYITGFDLTATLNPILAYIQGSTTSIFFIRANDNAAPTNLAANSSSGTGAVTVFAHYQV